MVGSATGCNRLSLLNLVLIVVACKTTNRFMTMALSIDDILN